jgi:hypothetical protein
MKMASLLSNSVILAANTFLVGSSLRQRLHDRKREHIASNLQVIAEVASAAATLTKVVTETIEQHHAPGD